MKLLYSIATLLILAFKFASPVLGQNKLIEVDSISGVPSQALPFDEPFVLKILTKSPRVVGVAYLQHVGRDNFGDSYNYRQLIKEDQGWPKDVKLVNFTPDEYEVRKIDTQLYILIHVNNPKLLAPGKRYTFFWAEEVSDDILDLFDLYNSNQLSRNAEVLKKAQDLYKKIAQDIKKKFNYPLNFPADASDITNLTRVKELYQDLALGLPKSYSTLAVNNDIFSTTLTRTSALAKVSDANSLTTLAHEIVKRTPSFDHELRQKYLTSETKATTRLYRLYQVSMDAATRIRLLNGQDNIDCNNCDPTLLTKYEVRAANLNTTLNAVDELLSVADLLTPPGSSGDLQKASAVLHTLQTDLRKLVTAFGKVITSRKEIRNKLFNQAFSELKPLGGNTYTYSFDTRNKLSIAPDFGVVTTRIGNDGSNPYAFVPYLGFHINFRPINRDVPFKSYDHKLGHRLSLMFGWSLVSVDNGPKLSPGADSVSSFFSQGKGTLLTGLGFRLGNAVRITTGYMWYFGYTPNGTKPVVYDQRHLRTWPFVGLSLDLSLKDLLNGITDVFKGTPRRFSPPPPTTTSGTTTD